MKKVKSILFILVLIFSCNQKTDKMENSTNTGKNELQTELSAQKYVSGFDMIEDFEKIKKFLKSILSN